MHFKKYISALLIVLIAALSGCAQNKTEEKAVVKEELIDKGMVPVEPAEKGIEPIEVVKNAGYSPAAPPIPAEPAVGRPVSEVAAAESAEGELIIADFEGWPNNLGGEVGVYGSLEPDWEQVNQGPVSWVYEATSLNYNTENVHSGTNSFRLVNGTGLKPEYAWGSFSMDLGPTRDITSVPKKVESLDASEYKYLVFWVKGEKGGEKMELLVRDAHALNYSPQIKYKLPDASREWKKIVIPLSDISGKADITKLDNIGIAFGKDVGNLTNDTIYIDDFVFTPLENPLP
ncbi:MAG: carbohydrate binding domain-containing protein [Candidatus Omnitrophota bacterium]